MRLDIVESLWAGMAEYYDEQSRAIAPGSSWCSDPLGRFGRAAALGGAYDYHYNSDECLGAGAGYAMPWNIDLYAAWCRAEPQDRRACVRALNRENKKRWEIIEDAVGKAPGVPWGAFLAGVVSLSQGDSSASPIGVASVIQQEARTESEEWLLKALWWSASADFPYSRWWRSTAHPVWHAAPQLREIMTSAERNDLGRWATLIPHPSATAFGVRAIQSLQRRRGAA